MLFQKILGFCQGVEFSDIYEMQILVYVGIDGYAVAHAQIEVDDGELALPLVEERREGRSNDAKAISSIP